MEDFHSGDEKNQESQLTTLSISFDIEVSSDADSERVTIAGELIKIKGQLVEAD